MWWIAGVVFLVIFLCMAAALAFGGPRAPRKPAKGMFDEFSRLDYSDLPQVSRFTARDGAPLAYRSYSPPAGQGASAGSAVLVHGSSGNGGSMHFLARALAQAGYEVRAPDIRGHGRSGPKGDIARIGQLEDDMQDMLRALQLPGPVILCGLSAGGGFTLRVAAGSQQDMFDGYLALAPAISVQAPTFIPDNGGWSSFGIPRMLALSFLNALHIRVFNHLPVVAFALDERSRNLLTARYSWNLMLNFNMALDWRGAIRAIRRPLGIVAGCDDSFIRTDQYASVFAAEGRDDVGIRLLPGIGHLALVLDERAIAAIVEVMQQLRAQINDPAKPAG